LYEVPPTAGLPLEWRDFIPGGRSPDLAGGLSAFLGVESIGVTCSGTASLVVTLEALKRRSHRRTVIIPAYTCPLVPLAVAHVGLRVRVCDVPADGGSGFDADDLARACDPDTLAVMPTHLAGMVADLEPVLAMAAGVGAYVIEDAAQALGATWRGRPVGTLGDIGCYSLSRGKGLTIYEGGFWVAREPDLRTVVARTADELLPPRGGIELMRIVEVLGYRVLYNPRGLVFAYGMPLRRSLARGDMLRVVGDEPRSTIPLHRVGAWRTRIGAAALRRLPGAIAENVGRGRARAAMLRDIPGIDVLDERRETTGTWPLLTVRTRSREVRDRVLAELWGAGLGVGRLFLHDLTGYRYLEHIVPRAEVPHARALAAQSFTISNSVHLSEQRFQRIRDVIARSV
jgi:dTDP-4-amino-4,6-dideoxygalactose transaminase